MKETIRTFAAAMCFAMMLALIPQAGHAAAGYMPDVTAEMSSPSFWSDKMKEPDRVLADESKLAEMQQAIIEGKGTGVWDLSTYTKTTFNGKQAADDLKAEGVKNAKYVYSSMWGRYDAEGNDIATEEDALNGYYKPMIDNCYDQNAEEEMPVLYAVCTKRTCLTVFPSDEPLYDTSKKQPDFDPDFDNKYTSAVRVNEPLILKARSDDKKYYQASTSFSSGWIAKSDVAICKDRDEWLDAWKFSPSKTLVVCADKIRTEDSNSDPVVSDKLLTMGTCLELADESEWTGTISNRSAHNNHVVWMPVRDDEGNYKKQLALIGENRNVSEGFLPLTSGNIIKTAFNWLGDAYGWGGMLNSNDCSGYVRDVYQCFGLELARNTTGQSNQPVKRYDLSKKNKEEKAEIIKQLPAGAVLIWPSHEMIYLGDEGDKLYVISAVSKVRLDGKIVRTRNVMINTLDMSGIGGSDWLKELTVANVPYLNDKDALPERKTEPKPDPAARPAAPKISVSVCGNITTADVSWDEIGDASRYITSVKKAGAKKWTEKSTAKAHYTFSHLKKKGLYQFKTVTVKKDDGKEISSKDSNLVNAYMSRVSAKMKTGKKKIALKWNRDKKAGGYKIVYADNSKMKKARVKIIKSGKVTSCKIKKLSKKKKHYVKICPYKKYKNEIYEGRMTKAKK